MNNQPIFAQRAHIALKGDRQVLDLISIYLKIYIWRSGSLSLWGITLSKQCAQYAKRIGSTLRYKRWKRQWMDIQEGDRTVPVLVSVGVLFAVTLSSGYIIPRGYNPPHGRTIHAVGFDGPGAYGGAGDHLRAIDLSEGNESHPNPTGLRDGAGPKHNLPADKERPPSMSIAGSVRSTTRPAQVLLQASNVGCESVLISGRLTAGREPASGIPSTSSAVFWNE
jgi:hypothetical protein